jgi:hypothetical protein
MERKRRSIAESKIGDARKKEEKNGRKNGALPISSSTSLLQCALQQAVHQALSPAAPPNYR